MTNSKNGSMSMHRIFSAILRLRGWDWVDAIPSRNYVPHVSYDESVWKDQRWKRWLGDWQGYHITEVDHRPRLAWNDLPSVALWSALAPHADVHVQFFLVAEGLEIALELRLEQEVETVNVLSWGIDADSRGTWTMLKARE